MIYVFCRTNNPLSSLPAWECGLKSLAIVTWIDWNCHSLRGSVDWNCYFLICSVKSFVTPCVGVWIEIIFGLQGFSSFITVTPCVGVWIEIVFVHVNEFDIVRHSLRGSVDWNINCSKSIYSNLCHSLRGSVDWNLLGNNYHLWSASSLPAWECGLKWFFSMLNLSAISHSLRGSVDWNIYYRFVV